MIAPFIFMALLIAVLFYVAMPLLRADRKAVDIDGMGRLLATRDLLLQEIQDVAQDLAQSKISQVDFDAFRKEKEAELAEILRQVAALKAGAA